MALTVSQIEKALRAKGGFVSQVAKDLGVTASAIYYRIENSTQLQKVKKEIDESYLDLAESKLVKQMNDGNLGALCFYLKCKGKGRGYIEKQQMEISGDPDKPAIQKLEIEFVKATDKK